MVAVLFVAALATSFFVRLDVAVDGMGALQPARVWQIRSDEAEVVREILVAEGDSVYAGQVLARLDTLTLATNLAELESERRSLALGLNSTRSRLALDGSSVTEQRAQVEARLIRARAVLRERMLDLGLGSDPDSLMSVYSVGTLVGIDLVLADVLERESELRSLEIEKERLGASSIELEQQEEQLRRLDRQLEEVRHRLGQLTLRAPADGVVLTHDLDQVPGRLTREGEVVLELAERREWRAMLLVQERNVYRVRVGDRVQIELQAFDRTRRPDIRGKVVAVGAEPIRAGSNQGFPVEVGLDVDDVSAAGPDRLRRGYTVRASIITRSERLLTLAWDYLLERVDRLRREEEEHVAGR